MKTILKLWLPVLALGTLTSCNDRGTDLFDGHTLSGWECEPAGLISDWKAENGILTGENADSLASIIWTLDQYGDFEVELEYMTPSKDYDSGIFIRGESHQVQIGISRSLGKDMTACIYAPGDDRGSYPGQTDRVTEVHKEGEWNHLKVIVTGKRIQTFLNGEPMVDYTGVVIPEVGPVGLQLHGGVHMVMHFRNIRLKEIGANS